MSMTVGDPGLCGGTGGSHVLSLGSQIMLNIACQISMGK